MLWWLPLSTIWCTVYRRTATQVISHRTWHLSSISVHKAESKRYLRQGCKPSIICYQIHILLSPSWSVTGHNILPQCPEKNCYSRDWINKLNHGRGHWNICDYCNSNIRCSQNWSITCFFVILRFLQCFVLFSGTCTLSCVELWPSPPSRCNSLLHQTRQVSGVNCVSYCTLWQALK